MTGRNKLTYVIIQLTMLVMAFSSTNSFFWIWFTILTVIPIVSKIIFMISRSKVNIYMKVTRNVIHNGEIGSVRIVVDNASIIPVLGLILNVSVRYSNEEQAVDKEIKISADSNSACGYSFAFNAVVSGVYEIVINKVVIYDILRLSKKRRSINLCERIVAIPKEIQINCNIEKESNKDEQNEEVYTKAIDKQGVDIEGIHEYRNGDRIKNIHWKLSSKVDEFLVKEYAVEGKNKVDLLMELNTNERIKEINTQNKFFDTAYSIGIKMINNGIPIRWIYLNEEEMYPVIEKINIFSVEELNDAFAKTLRSKKSINSNLLNYLDANNVEIFKNSLYFTMGPIASTEIRYEYLANINATTVLIEDYSDINVSTLFNYLENNEQKVIKLSVGVESCDEQIIQIQV